MAPRPPAVAFCSFWFFENFLYIGTYMSDARTSALPLVGGDFVHAVGILAKDQLIGDNMRDLGWLGMFATIRLLMVTNALASFSASFFSK